MKDFQGRIAVVTGAASGIGRGMTETFVAAGMKVVLADVEVPALEETTRALRDAGADVHCVPTDVSKADQVEELAKRVLDRYGAVHVLCNNAGIGAMGGDGGGGSWRASLDDWHWIVGVNLMGVVHGVRSFLPIMIEQGSEAHIVNTASLAGLLPGGTLYGTTKFAVVGFSENLHLELQRGGHKPRISVLCPGLVDTNIMRSERNRPAGSGAAEPRQVSPEVAARREWFAELLKTGMSPRAVGEHVLAGIREERFYILTHPEFNPMIEQRVRAILSGQNPAPLAQPPEMQAAIQALMQKRGTQS